MANAPFARLSGAASPAQGANVIPAYVPTGTSATVLTNQPGNAAVLTVATGAELSSTTSASTSFGVNQDGIPFKIKISGKVTTGASCNVTVAIQQGSSTTVTSGNTIATTGAVAVNTASANFLLEAVCVWDNVTQKIMGYQTGQINNSLVSLAALTNAVAITSQSSLQFVPVITFSATTGANMTISEFVAEPY